MLLLLLLLSLIFGSVHSNSNIRKFPDNFLFGIASSAYQIEGAWNENGKGVHIWDTLTHDHPEKIIDGSNGDIACDSYHKIEEDIHNLKELGVNFYRFSLSWSRILPTGFVDKINLDGIRYYNELIDALIKNNIEPMITLYHWDLPQPLQDCGGWPNPLIADYFADFAQVAFDHFGNRVKLWITLNEPFHVCQSGYGTGIMAPGIKNDHAKFMCSYTALLAHAKAYHIYDKKFRHLQKGKIGITLDALWYEPKTGSSDDLYATLLAMEMNNGWFFHPIFSTTGDFPPLMKEHILNNSLAQNLKRSRLPEFTKDQINYIRGSADFVGLNHYTSLAISKRSRPSNMSTSTDAFGSIDLNVNLEQLPEWESTPTSWLKVVPSGFRKILNWIKIQFNNPKVYITENGMGDTEPVINDRQRINYVKKYLEALLNAVQIDGCNVKAYTLWTLMDNYEWQSGYTLRFGIYQVNSTDPEKRRVPKASAKYYKKIIETHKLEHDL